MDMHSGTFNPQDFAWQGLTLTPAAAIHIRELVAKQPGMVGVRLGVKQTGCAGFGYVLDSVSEPDKDDLLFEQCLAHNPRYAVLVDEQAAQRLLDIHG